eukprot:SAG11_NODE_5297_length_1603_cov_5.816099_2_plen_187_part_00
MRARMPLPRQAYSAFLGAIFERIAWRPPSGVWRLRALSDVECIVRGDGVRALQGVVLADPQGDQDLDVDAARVRAIAEDTMSAQSPSSCEAGDGAGGASTATEAAGSGGLRSRELQLMAEAGGPAAAARETFHFHSLLQVRTPSLPAVRRPPPLLPGCANSAGRRVRRCVAHTVLGSGQRAPAHVS